MLALSPGDIFMDRMMRLARGFRKPALKQRRRDCRTVSMQTPLASAKGLFYSPSRKIPGQRA
jgi:hypothetical protein